MLWIIGYFLGVAILVKFFRGRVDEDHKLDYALAIVMWPFLLVLAVTFAPFSLFVFVLNAAGEKLL